MTDKAKNVRISDIARMAGVSVGTVDRILHNRGKVSKTAQEKVNRVLQEVEYRPNLMARSLALKKQFNIAALIPAFRPGEYWEKVAEGADSQSRAERLLRCRRNISSINMTNYFGSRFRNGSF